jgi:hypothetical protein
MVRQAREERGMLPQQLAAVIGVPPADVEFVETHGVAVTASMLAVLHELGLEDHGSEQLARLAQLIPSPAGETIVRQLVEGGYKALEEIEVSAGGELLRLPWFDLGQLSLLREGLRLYRAGEATGDVDES